MGNEKSFKPGYVLVFAKYIRRKGRIIYPKRGKCFRFWAKVKK